MSYRKEKIEELLRRLISDLIINGIKDPRIGFASITGVVLNKDFTLAKIGISVLGEARDIRKTLDGLNSACGYIQYKIGKSLRLRNTPKIKFFLDSSVVEGVEMVNLLEDLEADQSRLDNSKGQ